MIHVFQVHIVLSEVASEHVSNDCTHPVADYSDDDEDDLSDTDNEDEWGTMVAV